MMERVLWVVGAFAVYAAGLTIWVFGQVAGFNDGIEKGWDAGWTAGRQTSKEIEGRQLKWQ